MMKKKYAEMTAAERQAEYAAVQKEYEDAKALHLSLNMARGKPGREQLELVMPILGVLTRSEQFLSDGVETRNYGEVAGIPAARRLFADILGCKPEHAYSPPHCPSTPTKNANSPKKAARSEMHGAST